jgi:hypothetical protein
VKPAPSAEALANAARQLGLDANELAEHATKIAALRSAQTEGASNRDAAITSAAKQLGLAAEDLAVHARELRGRR